MDKLVHVQTQVTTTFGLLDNDGNVIPQQPIAVQINKFTPEELVAAHARISAERDQAWENYRKSQPPPRVTPRRPKR